MTTATIRKPSVVTTPGYFGSKISERMTKTDEGFLICHDVPIARTGTQQYLGREIGLFGEDGDKLITVYRTPEEVFSPETISSFEGKPFADNHPNMDVNPDNVMWIGKGVVKNVHRGTGPESNMLVADIVVLDRSTIRAIENGKREVSCGYRCQYVPRGDGTYQQQEIRGNHVALVDEGRAGASVRIRDAAAAVLDWFRGNGGEEMGFGRSTRDDDEVVKDAVDRYMIDADKKSACDVHKNDDGTFKGGFDGAVKYFVCKGYDEEVAKKIAGKIAASKSDDSTPKEAKDSMTTKWKNAINRIRRPYGYRDLFMSEGLRRFAQDAEPEDVMDALDELTAERREEEDRRAKDSRGRDKEPHGDDKGAQDLPGEDGKTKDAKAKDDDSERIDNLEKKIDEVMSMIKGLHDSTDAKTRDKSADEMIEDAMKQLDTEQKVEKVSEEGAHAINAASEAASNSNPEWAGPVMPEEGRPRSGEEVINRVFDSATAKAMLANLKPAIAAIKDPAEQRRVADAAIKSVLGAAKQNTYAEIAGGLRANAADAKAQAQAQYPNQQSREKMLETLGTNIAASRNPHYKKEA